MALQSFSNAIAKLSKHEKPSILLGNGFSQDWEYKIFNYKNLLQQANFGARHNEIDSIFKKFETYDFETVMRVLEGAEEVCKIYGVDQSDIKSIHDDQEQLKNALVTSISNNHPIRSSKLQINEYQTAKTFLKQFKKIFTVNYDLLLYWVINKFEVNPIGYHHWNDGFRGASWINRDDQTVFFLHGALHLYDTDSQIEKHTFNDDLDIGIIDKVKNNLARGVFPLFVSEPSSYKKLSKIRRNPYLLDCYSKLKLIDGVLFIHGHSIDANDKHLFDQINVSNVAKVFVSIYGNEYEPWNILSKSNALAYLHGKQVEFYDASSAPIWR